MPFKLY